MSASVVIRRMIEQDIEVLAVAFAPWNKSRAQYERYFAENRSGERITLVAFVEGEVAGYGNLVWRSDYWPFEAQGIPEISDLNTLEPYRRRGIASAIIAECERIAAASGKCLIGIGVGLTPDYANAQRLYPKLGYEYDGQGARPTPWGDVSHLTKRLS